MLLKLDLIDSAFVEELQLSAGIMEWCEIGFH
jgi:hypothetical protein